MKPSVMLNFRSRSLAKDLVISLFLLVFLVEGVLFALIYERQSRLLRHELEEKGSAYIENLREILAVPIWNFDDEQIVRIGTNFIQNELVGGLYITGGEDAGLFEYRHPKPGESITRFGDILYEGRKIGRIKLLLSLDTYSRELGWLRNTVVMMLVGTLAVIFVPAGLMLRTLLRTPLGALQKGMDRMAKGDYSYPFDEIRHIELAGIAQRFREMASEIQAREISLNRMNTELEDEISVRKKIEMRIRESEARSRALLDAVPDLIFQFDRDGKILDFRGRKEDLQTDAKDFIGKRVDDISPSHIAARFKKHIVGALETGQIQFFEYEVEENGQSTFFECRIVAAGPEMALSIIRNITRSKRDAAERIRLEEQLRQAQKMEALGTLAGGVAHDLNNILSGIVSYPELLLMDIDPSAPMYKPLTVIKESGEKAATIVQDLLTLARRGVTAREVVNLNDILARYLSSPEMTKLKAYHPGVRIVTRQEKPLLNVMGSAVHLSKTLMNLVSNAAEAMAEGGTIRVTTSNQYIDLPVKGYDDVAEGDYAVLTVSDTGVGILQDDLERIFEPFYTKKVMGRSGTGLGMAVVWGTVKDHNGYIDIRSVPGTGTAITVYLPATREALPEDITPVSIEDYKGSGEEILVVDDVEHQRDIASGILRSLGYHVSTVESGEQAVEYVKDQPVDLMILDMIMDPGIDGLEAYQRIVAIRPGQRAIIASGFSETDRVKQAQTLGVGSYIKKPYTIEKIGTAVKKELEKAPSVSNNG